MILNPVPIYSALKDYAGEGNLRLHMPGHIGGWGFEADEFKALASLDVTEIPGLDDLHAPSAAIEEGRHLLARAFGARESFFLVNGASSGLHALFLALKDEGDKVLVPRNAHRSFFGAMVLAGTTPVYIPCQVDKRLGAALTVTGEDVQDLLNLNPDAGAVFAVSPSYYGTTCDIITISGICHNRNLPLLVDEAHGGHFPFHQAYPQPALKGGADAVVNGLHKTLPVLNQGACLHLGEGYPDRERLFSAVSLLTTTSPSFPILASIDLARNLMEERGQALLEQALNLAAEYRRKINAITGLHCYESQDFKATGGVSEVDPLKLLVSVQDLTIDGYEVAALLRNRYRIQVEMADSESLLAMMALLHREEDWERYYQALRQIAAVYAGRPERRKIETPPYPQVYLNPRQAFMAPRRRINLEHAAGLIAAEMITAYPPGIPCLLPGEYVGPEVYDYLLFLKANKIHLQGPGDLSLETISVIDA